MAEIDREGTTCKRYYADEYGNVELRSVNPKYEPMRDFESLRIIGLVLLPK